MHQTIVRVRATNGQWRVDRNGTVITRLPEREEAVALARELASRDHGFLIAEDRAGRLVERNDYNQ
jgi:hypothetical protein